MENDEFNPSPRQPAPEPHYDPGKDPYAEPPIKDFSHLLNGKPAPKSSRHIWRKLLIVFLILLILGGGAGAYWKFFRVKPAKHVVHEVAKTQQAVSNKALPTSSYVSSGFGVTLNYPSNWLINDGGATSLSITSAVMKLTSDSGQSVNGKVIVLFQPEGKIPSEFGSSSAEAVLPSQLVAYTNPGSTQAAQTYLSFLQYSSATVTGTLNAIYVTGNYGFQKDDIIPQTDLTALNPLITISFGQCANTTCTNLEDLSVSSSEWSNSSFARPILNILKSLQFS
jgi:hypothetical protein